MVRRTGSTPRAAIAALVLLGLAASGCTQAVNTGLRWLGLQRSDDRPAVATSTYEHAPTFTWGRFAVGPPAGPANFFQSEGALAACSVVGPGLTRVLPIRAGAPAFGVQRLGPVTVGVAGYGGEMFRQAWSLNTSGLAQGALQHNARLSTVGGCNKSLFAFVSFGLGRAYDPVVVR